MAEMGFSNNDYFYPGSTVNCLTRNNMEIEGEVMAFDKATGVLILSKLTMSKVFSGVVNDWSSTTFLI